MSLRNTRSSQPVRWLLLAGALLLLGSSACDEAATTDAPEKKASTLPPARIDLPSVPADLGVPKTPEKHGDGSLTVEGLLRNRPKYLNQEIQVKGHITAIYDCPHWEKNQPKNPRKKKVRKIKMEAEEDIAAKMCERPHFYLVSKADEKPGEKSLLVVGLPQFIQDKIDEEEIKSGEEHTLSGTFGELAEGFTAAEKGLLRLASVKGFEPEPEEDGKN